MFDKTTICNMALGHIGENNQIADFDTENSASARACRLYYDLARKNLLSDFPWSFGRKVANLALLSDEEVEEGNFQYTYAMPTDCLVPRAIIQPNIAIGPIYQYYCNCFGYGGTYGESLPEYMRAQFTQGVTADGNTRTILTNQEDAQLLYTFDQDLAPVFTSTFTEALSWRLAAYLANAVAHSSSAADQAMQAYNQIIQQAAAQDASGNQDPLWPTPDTISSRLC